jgi:neutrophil factor 2
MTTQLEVTRFWNEGVIKCDQKDYAGALDVLKKISEPTSKVTFDIGCIGLFTGDLVTALKYFDVSVKKDEHMVVGFFQRGIAKYKQARYRDARDDFSKAYSLLRGNPLIDYRQLSMNLKLYACEILLNRAACHSRLGNVTEASKDLDTAFEGKVIPAHNVVDEAISALKNGSPIRLFELPPEALYRPPSYKTEHMDARNYLGKATVLSSVTDQDAYTGFEGAKKYSNSPATKKKELPSSEKDTKNTTSSSPKPKSPVATPKLPKGTQYQAIYEFTPSTEWEIALEEGDIVVVTEKGADGWHTATNTRTLQSGLVPATYMKEVSKSNQDAVLKEKRKSYPVQTGRKSPQPPAKRAPSPSAFKSPSRSGFTSPKFGRKSPRSQTILIKIHFHDTRTIEIPLGTGLAEITTKAQKKFEVEDKQITLWREVSTQIVCIRSDADMEETWKSVNEGRLTLWMFEEKVNQQGVPYIYEAEALYDYDAAHAGDLGFREGDIIQVTVEVNDDWLEGRSRGNMGIFPKQYVRKL